MSTTNTESTKSHFSFILGKLLLLAFVVIITAACTTSLATIKSRPDHYVGDIVRIQGSLTHKLPLPFTDIGVYILDDTTASMVIVAPAEYDSGQILNTQAQVIGISEGDAVKTAKNSVEQIADALVSREIVEPANARKVAKVMVKAVSKISGPIAGSYLLLDRQL